MLTYRFIEYNKIDGVMFIAESINILYSDPNEPKFGTFERLVDPKLRISQFSLVQWDEEYDESVI